MEFWGAWSRAPCFPECFCEAARTGVVVEPTNTASNIAFVLVGIALLVSASRFSDPPRARLTGFLCLELGIGSAWYHMSMTYAGMVADVMGMFIVATYFLVVKLGRRYAWSLRMHTLLYVGINILGLLSLLYAPSLRRFIFGGFVALLVIAITVSRIKRPHRWWAALTFLLAYGIWNLDHHQIVCDPYGGFNGHAVWHFLNATVIWWLAVYTFGKTPLHTPHPYLRNLPKRIATSGEA